MRVRGSPFAGAEVSAMRSRNTLSIAHRKAESVLPRAGRGHHDEGVLACGDRVPTRPA